jgi:hypothetical protein
MGAEAPATSLPAAIALHHPTAAAAAEAAAVAAVAVGTALAAAKMVILPTPRLERGRTEKWVSKLIIINSGYPFRWILRRILKKFTLP